MSSPCPTRLAAAAVTLGLALGVAACHGPNPPGAQPPLAQASAPLPAVSHLYPGEAQPAPEPPQLVAFGKDPGHIANGKLYYTAYNCTGCHANGGGAIGPAFMDEKWLYGGSLEEIHNSIAEGRPNGMPVWGRKIPDAQIWEIAAYVHSLSAESAQGKGAENPSPPPPITAKPAESGGQTPASG
ncbi:MAG TPA: c-type cytochrome [Phenylobacterium sp.]|jgi:cytochrome c oxidase cbb3-type subunit 3|nr:c-type cytochrome [Phenylobacterium sp.]